MDLSQEAVQLEIVEDWWIWRGFRPFVRAEEKFIPTPELKEHQFAKLHDAMDQYKFSEDRAFPLTKPAIDVFGVPPRSRKQRGWYQVVSPSLPAIPLDHTVLRSAADLPPELIATIADDSNSVSCTRVCRYWANILQPRVFAKGLAILSSAEMEQLFDIRRTSLTNLARYGMSLHLRDTLRNEPFTHRASSVKPGSVGLHTLHIIGPLPPSSGVTLRSINGRLPRSLPRSSILHLSRLWLRDVHFRYLTDLLRLVWELTVLEYFGGFQLTWKSESTRPGGLAAWVASRRGIPRLENLSLEDCPQIGRAHV